MPNHTLIRPRMPLALVAAVTALAVTSAPALAGTDGSPCADGAAVVAHTSGGSDCPPPAPVAPAPVAPTPVPVTPAPVAPAPVKAPSKPHKKKTHKKKTAKKKAPAQTQVAAVQPRPVVVRQPTFVQTETVEQATVPSGGVQAGAGGTAPQAPRQLPVALLVPGLLLTLLAVGGGLRLAQVRSRR